MSGELAAEAGSGSVALGAGEGDDGDEGEDDESGATGGVVAGLTGATGAPGATGATREADGSGGTGAGLAEAGGGFRTGGLKREPCSIPVDAPGRVGSAAKNCSDGFPGIGVVFAGMTCVIFGVVGVL